MKKILLIHNKYRFFGGEDQSVENEIKLLNKYYDLKVIFESNFGIRDIGSWQNIQFHGESDVQVKNKQK